jgi:ketopantoate reductase
MKAAIVGAGALGRVYAARLSQRSSASVTLVVRQGRVALEPVRIERVDGDRAVDTWSTPVTSATIPPDADTVIVTVRGDQLDASLDVLLDATSAPVVVLTPMMPDDFARLSARHEDRMRAGMAGAVAYVNEKGVCRYWLPRMAATLVDQTSPASAPESPALVELVRALEAAGMSARLERGVHELNPATTVSITPAAMGLDAAGSIDALLDDAELLRLTLAAIGEGIELGKRIGKAAGWLTLLMPFVGKRMLKVGVSLARRSSPEAMTYVELHFGRKLHAQNVAMARAIVELARTKGTPHEATGALLARLENRRAC